MIQLLLTTFVVAAFAHETVEVRVLRFEERQKYDLKIQFTYLHILYQLHGAGTTNPSKFFWQVQDLMMERAKVPMFLTYRAVGSSTGMKEFMGKIGTFEPLNDFGAGDIPMSAERYANITGLAGREMVHIPFVTGAIAFFHSVPSSDYSGSALDLNACLLARIFSSEITTWDHQDILDANPGFNPPAGQQILMAHRTKGSSSTTGISEYVGPFLMNVGCITHITLKYNINNTSNKNTNRYLNSTCPSGWSLDIGSTVSWAGGAAVQGSGGMSDYIEANPYAIGYIDAGHGHNLGLSEIAVQNRDGNYLTSLEADIASTISGLGNPFPDSSSDFSGFNLYDLAGAQAWPVTMVTYLYVHESSSSKTIPPRESTSIFRTQVPAKEHDCDGSREMRSLESFR